MLAFALGCEGSIRDGFGDAVDHSRSRGAAGSVVSEAGSGAPPSSGTGPIAAGSGASPRAGADAPSAATCEGVVDVGVAPLRRLTRTEYERTVADVFGVSDPALAAGLAIDERIDGVFASNLSSPVAVVQVRQYLDAAELVASKVRLDELAPCDRAAKGDEGCARELVTKLGVRAYRRPLVDEEISRYLTLYRGVVMLEGHEPALRAIVQGLLQSPHLLYHLELEPGDGALPNSVARLPGYALASRLSFFLWSGPPDAPLLAAAETGELDSDAGVVKQARRLLDDPRAKHAIESFHDQWLGLGRLDQASRDPQLFPEWNGELVSALRGENATFSDHVIREQDGDLASLLTASYSFPSGPALAIRGVAAGPSGEPIALQSERGVGLLTQPAFLAAHSHSNQSSPIQRGRALRERFFCQPLPDPPPDVAAVAPELASGLTTRERFAMHRTAGSACFGCHRLIDDLGFALEHFDALGRYREREEGKPIDASGQLIATDVDGSLDGARALAQRMAQSDQVQQCYAKQWLRYALGRQEEDADRCALERIAKQFESAGTITELLIAITTSDAFLRQRVEE